MFTAPVLMMRTTVVRTNLSDLGLGSIPLGAQGANIKI